MNDLFNKKLLILGGSYCKDAIKQFSEEYSVKLIAAGNNPTAEMCLIADEYYNINTTDPEAVKKLIIEKSIDGIYLGSSEPVIGSAISYLPQMGFPCYCTKEQWDTIQNKATLKEHFIKFGLPVVPRYKLDYNEIETNADTINFPVITKPADGCGSRGFSICNTKDELLSGYKLASENSYSGEVIIEKFVNNKGVVAFFSFTDGKMVFLGMEDKYPRVYTENGSYVAGLLVFESRFTQEFSERFCQKLSDMFKSLGLKEGTLWLEIFKDGDNYYFNEAGYRYGGSATVYPIDYLYNVNQVYADMYYALTGKSKLYDHSPLVSPSIPRKKHYCIYPLYIESGTIKEINGIQKLNNTDSIVKTVITKHKGDVVEATGDFSQNFALIHFVFNSANELKEIISEIHNTITVIDINNRNMLVEPLDIEKINPNIYT